VSSNLQSRVTKNNLKQTEGSSDPSMAGVNANESTDEHVDAVCKHGEAMQKDDTNQLTQFTPRGPLPPSEPQNVSSADESTAENKICKQKGLVDDDKQQLQISPSGAGALKDEPPSDTKLEAANTGNADQETEKSGGAEPSNNLQQTESSSDQQQQQDLSKSSRNPLCQLVSGSVFNSVSTSEDWTGPADRPKGWIAAEVMGDNIAAETKEFFPWLGNEFQKQAKWASWAASSSVQCRMSPKIGETKRKVHDQTGRDVSADELPSRGEG